MTERNKTESKVIKMQDYSDFKMSFEIPIIKAMEKINANSQGIVFICDNDNAVIAALTDGDIRRHILTGKTLEAPAIEAANRNFRYVTTDDEYKNAHKTCIEESLTALPKLNERGHITAIYLMNETNSTINPQISVPVVIMAGGKGTRLYPYTKVLPKPLVPIGEDTITEYIMNRFIDYGCNDFTMIVNHKKNMIKAYFSEEGQKYNIKFIDEDIPLGTGGGLKLLKKSITSTFFMSNCDVLIFADYAEILSLHKETDNIITMICAAKTLTVPYGTVEVNNEGVISSLIEKPSLSFLTNTGIYVIEPRFLDYIEPYVFTHITDSIQKCIDAGERVGVYPVSEGQWSDMGQLEEMEKMQRLLGI